MAVTTQGVAKFLNILGGKTAFVGSSGCLTALAETAPIGFHTGLVSAFAAYVRQVCLHFKRSRR